MSKFNSCLTQGKFYELETLKYIEYDTYRFSIGTFKEWDIEIHKNDEPLYYEVKSETNAFKYGNLCIEYEYKGEPSGIFRTTANFWVHYAIKDKLKNHYTLYIIPTNDLKQLITDKKYYRQTLGGDMNKSKCYLFRMKDLDKYKKCIKEDE
jgi:hypothetical protein